jgi:UDP-N-acetyl-D-glucosamine dehydrogenase
VASVVVVGQGYVGLPLAVLTAMQGHTVVGFDVDQSRVQRIESGQSFADDVSDLQLAAAFSSGRYRVTADSAQIAGFDVAIIAVPTPLRDGVPDLSFIVAATDALGRHLRPGALVVLESTTYPGTTEDVVGPALEARSGLTAGVDFHLGYSPERIDPGNRTWGLKETPKIVSGINAASVAAVLQFYGSVIERPVVVESVRVAELAKLIENTFRHVNIALVNEIAIFARDLDIDMWQAIDAAATKPFGFMRFEPGPGVGGHCLPIDPVYLSWHVSRKLGRPFRFVELANDVNAHMPVYVVQRMVKALNERRRAVNGSRILLLGLAYKSNSGDARESPAVRVAEQLVELGAEVRAADPHVVEYAVLPRHVVPVKASIDEVRDADIVVILADHDAFDYDMVQEHASYVLDCRNRVGNRDNVEVL